MFAKNLNDFITRHNYFPKYSNWVFVALVFVMSGIYNYHHILFLSPQSIHQWRQCDCLSITMNYFRDHNGFFEPAIHNLGRDGTGKTVSDFPLIYFIVAQLWKIFGYHEFIFRALNAALFFSGLFALFKIFESVLKDSLLAIVFTLLLFTSPVLAYYANNFLMNIPAFSFAIIGFYFFMRFSETSGNRNLYFFSFFYALAGLLKISSLLSFVAVFGLYVLERFNIKIKKDGKIFQSPGEQIIPLLAVFAIQLLWYSYALNYNNKYNSGIFLTGILPIWDLNRIQIREIMDGIREHIKWDYFRLETQAVFIFMFFFVLLFLKKADKILLLLNLAIATGSILYMLLFFQVFKDHDYYMIDLFILVPVTLLNFLLLLRKHFKKIYTSLFFKLAVIVFLIHNVDFARRRINGRYDANGWQNKEYHQSIKNYKEIIPYLNSIGISTHDRVLSLSDYSPDITLYLMNQKGWTNFGIMNDTNRIREKINLGASYLFINNNESTNLKTFAPFIKNKTGAYKNIEIYKLY